MPVSETLSALNLLQVLLYLEALGSGTHPGVFGSSASGIKSRPSHNCGVWLYWVYTQYAVKSHSVVILGL